MLNEKKAARQGGSSYITHDHFSSSVARGKDAIGDTIAGQMEGVRFVQGLRGNIVEPDLLFARIREIADDAATLRGFCRSLQKSIERGNE